MESAFSEDYYFVFITTQKAKLPMLNWQRSSTIPTNVTSELLLISLLRSRQHAISHHHGSIEEYFRLVMLKDALQKMIL
jgi:hypothetical protein